MNNPHNVQTAIDWKRQYYCQKEGALTAEEARVIDKAAEIVTKYGKAYLARMLRNLKG